MTVAPGILSRDAVFDNRPKAFRDIINSSTSQREIADQVNRLHGPTMKPDLITLPVLELENPFADKQAFSHSVFLAMQSNRLVESIGFLCGQYPTRMIKSMIPGSADRLTRLKVADAVGEAFLADTKAIGFSLEVDRSQNSYVFYFYYHTDPKLDRESLRVEGIASRNLARLEVAAMDLIPALARFEMDKRFQAIDWSPYYIAIRRTN